MNGGTVTGPFGSSVSTETRNGVTVRYRDQDGTQVTVTVGDAAVSGLRVVVRRGAPQ